MQDKKLDDMSKKYKEEMMRLYSKNRTANSASPPRPAPPAPTAAIRENHESPKPPEKAVQPVRNSPRSLHKEAERPSKSVLTERELSHPPMPEIPKSYLSAPPSAAKTEKRPAAQTQTSPKFPSAEEIMRRESLDPAVTAIADVQISRTVPEPRFEPAEEDTGEHNQGNYSSAASPDMEDPSDIPGEMEINESYPDESTDFSAIDSTESFPDDNPSEMSGQGYLQIEVTTASEAVPVRDATVIITESINGMDSLIGMLITDENGKTPIIPLSAPSKSFSEAPDPSERPYSEYNTGIYKQGFYAVPKLTVPIFDGVKSIQPVSMIPLAEFELEGAVHSNETRR